jgi:hypothetical protein
MVLRRSSLGITPLEAVGKKVLSVLCASVVVCFRSNFKTETQRCSGRNQNLLKT